MTIPSPNVQALSALPHGKEFRFVDEITDLVPGQSAVGFHTVQTEAEFLRGHFPEAPLFPGVLLIEALAQLGGVIGQTRPGVEPLAGLKLTAVQKFKITGSALPGERIRIEAQLDSALGHVLQVSGRLFNGGGQPIAAGVVMLAGQAG